MYRVIIVEDDKGIAEGICNCLAGAVLNTNDVIIRSEKHVTNERMNVKRSELYTLSRIPKDGFKKVLNNDRTVVTI